MKRHLLLLTACLPALLVPATTSSQEDEDDGDSTCVTTRIIDRTEILDNHTIVFHMRGGDIFLNRLDRTCRGLTPRSTFSYRTASSRLCASDSITVIERAGPRFESGATCGLGIFESIHEETLAMLKGEEPDAEVRVIPIEVEQTDGETIDEEEARAEE